jgi:hypothetical protein
MQKAMAAQQADNNSAEGAGRGRAAGAPAEATVRSAAVPRPATAVEAYTLRSLNEADSEFASYLLKFLRDFSAVSRRGAQGSSLGRALLSTARPGSERRGAAVPRGALTSPPPAASATADGLTKGRAFRVPPFAASLAEDSSTMASGLDGGQDSPRRDPAQVIAPRPRGRRSRSRS